MSVLNNKTDPLCFNSTCMIRSKFEILPAELRMDSDDKIDDKNSFVRPPSKRNCLLDFNLDDIRDR